MFSISHYKQGLTMKVGVRVNSNFLFSNVFYFLIGLSMFVTYRIWLTSPKETYSFNEYRLQDYNDKTIKKLRGKRFLPWKLYTDIEKSEVKDKDMRYILVWTSSKNGPFNRMGYGPEIFSDKFCPHYNCFITDDVNFLEVETEFDAIVFGAEVTKLTDNLLPEQRLPYQKYVFVSMGSAQENSVCTKKFNSYFNWTWTYRFDSEIRSGLVVRDVNETIVAPKKEVHWMSTQLKTKLPHGLNDIIKKKTKAAAWIVSDCNTHSYREKIALSLKEELKKHLLTLDIYGKCGEFHCGSQESCDKMIERDYFFYLSFEGSLCKDYVTTELMRALHHNVVPIVYGGTNYTRILPPGSYLDASQLSVSKLAGIMNRLIRVRRDSYAQYFWWKQHYNYYNTSESVDTDEYCVLCKLLNTESFKKNSVYTNFKDWWNHPDEVCLNWYDK